MKTWNNRPQDLKPEELNAWALSTITDALYNLEAGLQEAVSGLESLSSIASALRDLGTGDAAATMGAIEFLATEIRQGLGSLAESIEPLKR